MESIFGLIPEEMDARIKDRTRNPDPKFQALLERCSTEAERINARSRESEFMRPQDWNITINATTKAARSAIIKYS